MSRIIIFVPSANLAQMVEHFIRNERVVSSILIVGSTPPLSGQIIFNQSGILHP